MRSGVAVLLQPRLGQFYRTVNPGRPSAGRAGCGGGQCGEINARSLGTRTERS